MSTNSTLTPFENDVISALLYISVIIVFFIVLFIMWLMIKCTSKIEERFERNRKIQLEKTMEMKPLIIEQLMSVRSDLSVHQ